MEGHKGHKLYLQEGDKKPFLRIIFKTHRELPGVQLRVSGKIKVQSLPQPWLCMPHGFMLTPLDEMKGWALRFHQQTFPSSPPQIPTVSRQPQSAGGASSWLGKGDKEREIAPEQP